MKIGFHVSIADSIDNAVDRANQIGCNTFQIFTRSPRMWKHRTLKETEIHAFIEKRRQTGIHPVFSHMPYLPNLSTSNPDMYQKSIKTLEVEIDRCNLLEIPYIVTHLGSHLGKGPETGTKQIVNALRHVLEKYPESPKILLENTSGKRNEMGSSFEEQRKIMDMIDSQKVGVCFDTCHGFSRGYDLKTQNGLDGVVQVFDDIIGFKNLCLVHLNDSRDEFESRKDRHQHVGLGSIGEDGFRNFLKSRFAKAPMVMETPVDELRNDHENMAKVKELAGLV